MRDAPPVTDSHILHRRLGHTLPLAVATDGAYTISAEVKDNNGEAVKFTNLMTGAVSGLRYSDNQAVVIVNGEEFFVSEIYKVS